jgi:hypothetical protein
LFEGQQSKHKTMALVNRTKNWSLFFLTLVLFQIVFISYNVRQSEAGKRKKMIRRLGSLLLLLKLMKKPSFGIMPIPIPMK